MKEQADEKQQENELLEREKTQIEQEYDTLCMRVAVKQMDYEEADERVKDSRYKWWLKGDEHIFCESIRQQ